MAAKKGGAVALQQDVVTDEEWEALLRRPGLLLVDVYSEWCGPCVGMLANLKKIKVELGGDLLVLATAKSDAIEALRRHRNHSEPVWMLVSGGRLIDLIFGADAPRIARLIASELDNELKLQRGEECGRDYMSWDELTPEEEARLKRAEEKRLRAQQEEEERHARALQQQRADNYAKLSVKLNRYTVVLLLPHAVPGPEAEAAEAAAAAAAGDAGGGAATGVMGTLREAWTAHGLEERRRVSLAVSAEMADEVFFERKLPQHDELLKALATGPCLAVLLYKGPTEVEVCPEVEESEGDPAGAVEGAAGEAAAAGPDGDEPPSGENSPPSEAPPPSPPQRVLVEPEMGEVEALAAQSLYGFYPAQEPAPQDQQDQQQQQQQQQPDQPQNQDQKQQEQQQQHESGQEEQWWRFQPAMDSPAAACVRMGTGAGPALPGLWTPLTAATKAAAMQTLFPDDTLQLTKPPPPPSLLPPSLVFVYAAVRWKDIMVAAKQHEAAVTGTGFFTENREPLGVDGAEVEALNRERKDSDLFAVAVSVEASAAIEALSVLQPLATSASAEEGAHDCDEFFPGPSPAQPDGDRDDASTSGLP